MTQELDFTQTRCHDRQCRVQDTCWRWVHRDDPGIHRHASVFRRYEDPDGPCRHHIPAHSELGALLAAVDEIAPPSTS